MNIEPDAGANSNNPEEVPDPDLDAMLRRFAEELAGPMDEAEALLLAQACVAEVKRRRRRTIIGFATATAAAVLIVALGAWLYPKLGTQPIPDLPPAYAEGPAVSLKSAHEFLGPEGPPDEEDVFNLSLAAFSADAWVAIVEFRANEVLVRTATDEACLRVKGGEPELLAVPIRKIAGKPARVLVLWSAYPCGDALASAAENGRIKSFHVANEMEVLQSVAVVVNRKDPKNLLGYRFVNIK